jgi:hypothetical protein
VTVTCGLRRGLSLVLQATVPTVAPMTHDDPGITPPSAGDLRRVEAEFPAFEIICCLVRGQRRHRYVARRRDGQRGLHTIVTDDLAELRKALGQ